MKWSVPTAALRSMMNVRAAPGATASIRELVQVSNLEDSIFEEEPEEFDDAGVIFGFDSMTQYVSPRQLDVWTTKGYLELADRKSHQGSGHPRKWTEAAFIKALLMKRLTNAGFLSEHANLLATEILGDLGKDEKWITIKVGRGMELRITMREEWDGKLLWSTP
jgi:hypothetical protein